MMDILFLLTIIFWVVMGIAVPPRQLLIWLQIQSTNYRTLVPITADRMRGTGMSGATWVGPVSGAHNITMNAVASAPVAEPATMLIFGTGLVGSRLRKKKK